MKRLAYIAASFVRLQFYLLFTGRLLEGWQLMVGNDEEGRINFIAVVSDHRTTKEPGKRCVRYIVRRCYFPGFIPKMEMHCTHTITVPEN